MSYKERELKGLIAEHAVNQYLKSYGWFTSKTQVRESLSEEHNNKLSLEKMSDPPSLYVRHFPDHIATKDRTIFIQTKYAPTGYPLFNMEKESIDNLVLLPFRKSTILVYFIYEDAEFLAITVSNLKKHLVSWSVRNDGGTGGSGTPYYQISRRIFKDFSEFIGDSRQATTP
jgi:hypothetical protein